MTPEDLEAAQAVFSAEGRQLAEQQFGPALQRASDLGQTSRIAALQARIARETDKHVNKSMLRLARSATAGEAQSSAPVSAALPSSGDLFQGIQRLGGPPPAAPRMLENPNALLPPIDYGAPQFSPISAMPPPDQYSRSGYRPASGIAAGPQSVQEARDLASQTNAYNALMEASGMAPAGRSRQAFAEGRPIAGAANAAMAAFPYRPLAASIGAGATLATALAGDLIPRFTGSSSAEAEGTGGQADIPAEFRPMSRDEYFARNRTAVKSLDQALNDAEARVTSSPAYQGLIEEGRRTQATQMINQARKNAEDAYNKAKAGTAGEEQRLETGYQNYLTELEKQRTKFLTERQSASEYGGAVERAEAARSAELARNRPFDKTLTGQFFNATSGYTPGVIGGATGTILRAAGRPMSSVLPWSIAAGAVTPNWPLASDYYNQPSYNPERRAAEVYLRELPMNHPRRAQYEAMLSGPTALPADNPVKVAARNDLFDPLQFAERTFAGALEGATFGDLGAAAVDWRRGGGRDSTGTQWLLGKLGLRRGQQPTEAEPNAGMGTPNALASGATNAPIPQQPSVLATLGNQAPRRPLNPPEAPPPVPANATPPPTVQELLRRRRMEGPIEGGHWVAPNAPPTIGEAWVSPKGNKMWTRDREGRFVDETGELVRDRNGRLVTDPRSVRPDWRRISSIDEIRPSIVGQNALLG